MQTPSRSTITQPVARHSVQARLPMHRMRQMIALLLILPLLIIVNLVSLHTHGSIHQLRMGDGTDKLLLHNFHKTETDAQGTRYRWTRDEGSITFRGFVATSRALLHIKTGGLPAAIPAPRAVDMQLENAPWLTLNVMPFPRHALLLLPPEALRDGNLDIHLSTETSKVKPDTRNLGIRIDSIELGWLPTSRIAMPWNVLLVQWLFILCCISLWYRLAMPRWSLLLFTLGLVAALGWMTGSTLLIAALWQYRLLATAVAVLLIFWASMPLLHRLLPHDTARSEIRWLWLIALLAISVRMIPILYPPFESHDWYIHRKRIQDFMWGGFLIYDKPAEFSKKLTIVPPAPYLFYTPFNLFTKDPVVAMQWVYTLIDSMTTLLVGLLVRQVGGSIRASRLTAIIIAFFPLNFTALWWGFGPQVIGQCLTVLMALLITQWQRHRLSFWLVSTVAFSLLLLSHVGSGILGGSLVAAYIGLLWLFQRKQQPHWKVWMFVVIGSGILVTILLYSQVIEMQMSGLTSNQRLGWDEDDLFRVPWTLMSLYSSFTPLGVLLPIISIVWLVYRIYSRYRWLVLAWLSSAGVFFMVDLAFGLQVRYAYFLIPMIAIGLASMLDTLIARHRIGWVIAVCLIGVIGIAGLNLWLDGIFLGIKPSLRGLTH